MAVPLHALTRQDVTFLWTEQCEESFGRLKALLTSPPVLAYPDFDRPLVLHTDASTHGLGAVLEQEQADDKLHPVAYASRSLRKGEINYGVTELEALALVWAARHFRPYLLEHHCLVYTDHAPLKALLRAKNPSGKVARWAETLAELDLQVHYRPGRSIHMLTRCQGRPLRCSRCPSALVKRMSLLVMTKASPGEGEAYPCTCEENGCSCEDVQRSATSLVSEENEMENADGKC